MTKVLFKRKTSDEIAILPVEDGAIIYDYETGATYLDYDDERIPTGGGMPTGDTFPIGAISPYAGSVAPTNWLICDGRAISRVTYSDLFNAIGTTYGSGDGNTTFNLPNLKGRVITGLDTSQTEFDALGETGGEKTHLLTDNEIPPLTTYAPSQTTGGNMAYLNDWSGYTGTGLGNIPITKTKTTNASEHNNLQPYITLNYIIKAFQSSGTVANVTNVTTTSDTDTYSCNYINTINNKIYSVLSRNTNIDNLKTVGTYGIFNATGTLPSGYNQTDNNIFIDVLMWSNDYGRQILHDVRTTNTYVRNLSNNAWQSWKQINMT